jgi:hypothetical protein
MLCPCHYFLRTIRVKLRGRLSTVDLLIKIACFVKKEKYFPELKAADLKYAKFSDPSLFLRIPCLNMLFSRDYKDSATTFSIMTFSITIKNATLRIMAFSIMTKCCDAMCHYAEYCYAECRK